GYLVKATAKPGENYDDLRNMYTQLISQRDRELGHVASMVGGFVRNNVWFGDGERVYEPVPSARQREAVKFLTENALQVPPTPAPRGPPRPTARWVGGGAPPAPQTPRAAPPGAPGPPRAPPAGQIPPPPSGATAPPPSPSSPPWGRPSGGS